MSQNGRINFHKTFTTSRILKKVFNTLSNVSKPAQKWKDKVEKEVKKKREGKKINEIEIESLSVLEIQPQIIVQLNLHRRSFSTCTHT